MSSQLIHFVTANVELKLGCVNGLFGHAKSSGFLKTPCHWLAAVSIQVTHLGTPYL